MQELLLLRSYDGYIFLLAVVAEADSWAKGYEHVAGMSAAKQGNGTVLAERCPLVSYFPSCFRELKLDPADM